MYGTMVMTDSGMGDAIRAALHAMLEQSSDPDALLARLEREGELWADKLAQGAEAEEVMTLLAEAIANTRRATLDRGRH
jgi:Arc/MetJ-type ribon-helix-helix transcriptional regulator